MVKPKLLDLFCCAGGAAMGYYRAGFEVVGVDIKKQPNYPFKFIQADAVDFCVSGFDAVHASPPCQEYSRASLFAKKNLGKKYSDLVGVVRDKLVSAGKPFIIENVVGAPLLNSYMLCGTMFGLKILRHRLFESNCFMFIPPHVKHQGTVYGGDYITIAGMGGAMWYDKEKGIRRQGSRKTSDWKSAMGIDWMSRYELTQAIPPAYTEFLGQQLINYV